VHKFDLLINKVLLWELQRQLLSYTDQLSILVISVQLFIRDASFVPLLSILSLENGFDYLVH